MKAAKTIRMFSKEKKTYKTVNAIQPINITEETFFANGKHVRFYSTVSHRIQQFHKTKKVNITASDPLSEQL